jgi:hypothetical protein
VGKEKYVIFALVVGREKELWRDLSPKDREIEKSQRLERFMGQFRKGRSRSRIFESVTIKGGLVVTGG